MSSNLSQRKKHFRKLYKAHHWSDLRSDPCEDFFHSSLFARSQNIALYASTPTEFPTDALFVKCRSMGKKCYYPRICGEGMEFSELVSLTDLRRGQYGIREPKRWTTKDPEFLDLAIVPGTAFDQFGGRIGKGKGYYDRWLSVHKQIVSVGLCFEHQLWPKVPMESQDQKMRWVLTEKRWISCF
ncbi:MAG: 5-formyltetrahydrofolate cyclo-ligase [Bdellovibrionales bacterium]|nr:5-formyltetrahydrofolate cyclo-ligase [Bdellovibrionales bacterium]